MGCFLACFGFKEKKKRRKPSNKHPSSVEQDNQNYEPLDSNVAIKLDIKENLTSDISQLKEKPKPSILKLKKKVRFNLNVKAYEPIPDNDELAIYLSDGEETKNAVSLHYEEDAIASSIITSYPTNYRYQNCRYSDDEEDEDLKHDLDLDDQIHEESDDEEIDDVCSDDGLTGEEDFAWADGNDVTKYEEETSVDSQLQGIKSKSKSKSNARDRRQYVSSVLNPVENLSQWKVVKAKAAMAQFKLQKENLNMNPCPTFLKMRNQNVTVAVDGSLSNWLEKEKLPLIKSSTSDV